MMYTSIAINTMHCTVLLHICEAVIIQVLISMQFRTCLLAFRGVTLVSMTPCVHTQITRYILMVLPLSRPQRRGVAQAPDLLLSHVSL